jgi:hypothetical protein
MQFQVFICMYHLLLYSEYGFQTKVQLLFSNLMAGDGKSRDIPFTYCLFYYHFHTSMNTLNSVTQFPWFFQKSINRNCLHFTSKTKICLLRML